MMPIEYEHLLIFGTICVATWLLVTYLLPRLMLSIYKRAALYQGFGDGPIPVNTLYTQPQKLLADPFTPLPPGSSKLMSVGTNRDTLYVVGWLDLSKKPLVVSVPEMAGRYYSVQFTDPSRNINFAYVGKRTTGTQAGDYIISGPGRKRAAPQGMKQISSPNNAVLVVGRVFVENDNDLPTAYGLAKQIRLAPFESAQ
jgi:Protein of unknown function (DUF1254)